MCGMKTITFHAPDEEFDGRPLPPVELVVIKSKILGYVAPSMGYKHPRLLLADRPQGVEILETQEEFAALMRKPLPATTMRAATGGGLLAAQMRTARNALAAFGQPEEPPTPATTEESVWTTSHVIMTGADADAIAGYVSGPDLIVPGPDHCAVLVINYRWRATKEDAWEPRQRIIIIESDGEIFGATLEVEFHPVAPDTSEHEPTVPPAASD